MNVNVIWNESFMDHARSQPACNRRKFLSGVVSITAHPLSKLRVLRPRETTRPRLLLGRRISVSIFGARATKCYKLLDSPGPAENDNTWRRPTPTSALTVCATARPRGCKISREDTSHVRRVVFVNLSRRVNTPRAGVAQSVRRGAKTTRSRR